MEKIRVQFTPVDGPWNIVGKMQYCTRYGNARAISLQEHFSPTHAVALQQSETHRIALRDFSERDEGHFQSLTHDERSVLA